MKLTERLLALALEKKLAHFYILEPTKSSENAQGQCEAFCEDLFKKYFKALNLTVPENVWDHPDVITLGTRADQEEILNNFTVEEALGFIRHFEFAPINAPHKFAVITQAERISLTVANKWLKLLEEPNKDTTIILINSNRIKLLETIQSRGILLRLETTSSPLETEEFQGFIHEAKGLTLSQFIEKNQKSGKDVNYWSDKLISWESQMMDGAREKEQLGVWLNRLREMDSFHQPSATKWSLFYQYLQSNVFGRLIH